MKFLIILYIFFCSCCLAQTGISQSLQNILNDMLPESQLNPAQANRLEVELKLQTTIIEAIKQIDIQDGLIHHPVNASEKLSQILLSTSEEAITYIPPSNREKILLTLKDFYRPSKLVGMLNEFNLFLKKNLNQKSIALSAAGRRFGIQGALVYLATMQFDFTLPLVMLAHGEALGGVLLAMPISSTSLAMFMGFKKAFRYAILVKTLGVNKLKKYFESYHIARKFFSQNLFHTRNIIQLSFNNINFAMTLESGNFFIRKWSKFIRGEALTAEKIISVLGEETFNKNLIENLMRSSHQDNYKTLFLLSYLEENNNIDAIRKLEHFYPQNIRQVQYLRSIPTAQKKWFLDISQSKNFKELINHLKSLPTDIHPQLFDNIWTRFVLPRLSYTIDDYYAISNFKAFRKLSDNWEKSVRPFILQSNKSYIDDEVYRFFTDYFYNSIQSPAICETIYTKSLF